MLPSAAAARLYTAGLEDLQLFPSNLMSLLDHAGGENSHANISQKALNFLKGLPKNLNGSLQPGLCCSLCF